MVERVLSLLFTQTMASNSKQLHKTLNETHWLDHISLLLEPNNLETALETPTSIFKVPDSITNNKPEAYFPHRIAFGPYHHFRNDLYQMELYKLENAIKVRESFQLPQLNQIVDEQLKGLEFKIRSCFDEFLDIGSEALAWILLLDGLFLLQLLAISNDEKDERLRRLRPELCLPSPFPLFVEPKLYCCLIEGNLMTQDEFVNDILMLENQIPLLVLKSILPEKFGEKLDLLFFRFCEFVSPMKLLPLDLSQIFEQSHHLLNFLYLLLSDPRSRFRPQPYRARIRRSCLLEGLNVLFSLLAFLPPLSEAVGLIQSLLGLLGGVIGSSPSSTGEDMNGPPLIPSASQLRRVGVKLESDEVFNRSIRFEQKHRKVCLELPIITIDAYSEVVFRNLVAFEAASKEDRPWFGHYVALMSWLINTAKDVKILKQARIIESHSGSEEEVVKLFVGLRKVMELDDLSYNSSRIVKLAENPIVKDINRYYESRWRVKAKRFIQKYIIQVLKVMFVVVVILLILLVVVRTFCDLFGCSRILHLIKS